MRRLKKASTIISIVVFWAAVQSTALAQTSTQFGSGFFVSNEGHIITNEHVVRSCKKLTAVDQNRNQIRLVLIDASKKHDLALLKAAIRTKNTAEFGDINKIQQGDTIVTYGFPLAGLLSSSGNVSTGLITATEGLRDDPNMLQISAPVQPGNSGGPLADTTGAVIGIIVGKIKSSTFVQIFDDIPQNINFAIKEEPILQFLKKNKVVIIQANANKNLSLRTLTEKLKEITVQIVCETHDEPLQVKKPPFKDDSVRKKEIGFQIDDSIKNLPAYQLINLGWGLFTGLDGKVDEKAAYEYTKYGLQKAFSDLQENFRFNSHIVSGALNNIGVFHCCSGEPSIRNWNLGHAYFEEAYKYKGSSYAPSNLLWQFFLRERYLSNEEVKQLAEELQYNHKVFKYLNKLGRLPKNPQEAISFLIDEAKLGDPDAAQWIAYSLECGTEKLDFNATEWYKFSLSNSVYGSETYNTAAIRLQRLELLKKPQLQAVPKSPQQGAASLPPSAYKYHKDALEQQYSNSGYRYLENGQYDKAIEEYTKAISIKPNNDDYYYYRGIVYYKTGQYDKAIKDFTTAILLNSLYYGAYLNRGNAYVEKGEFGKAMKDYDRAIRIKPDYVKGYLAKGFALSKMGEFDSAILYYREAIKIDPYNAVAYYNRGIVYKKINEKEKAISDFKESCNLGDKDACEQLKSLGYR
jgi:tetratricopeptide (TPR) repeat protein